MAVINGFTEDITAFAIFGGQGPWCLSCLQDLKALHSTHAALFNDLLEAVVATLDDLVSAATTRSDFFDEDGFDLRGWLANPEVAPTPARIAQAPYSLPLIGTLSLAQYCIACRTLGKTPGELRSHFQGFSGHSQGVIAAAAVASSHDWPSFFRFVRLTIKILFWIGLESHVQSIFPHLPPLLSQDCMDRGEGCPSPMLSVRGLDEESVEALIEQTNALLAQDCQVKFALINSNDNFVTAGPPRSLLVLVGRIRQNKAFRTDYAFLPTSAPFHTNYLESSVCRVLLQLKQDSLLKSDLRASLYDTSTGEDLSKGDDIDLLEMLVRSVMTRPADWRVSANFSPPYIVDFGPGKVGSLVQKVNEGNKIKTLTADEIRSTSYKGDQPNNKPFSNELDNLPACWATDFGPRVSASQIHTRINDILGTPPVVVSGVAPTTCHWDVIEAILQAGYHAELALCGYHDARTLEMELRRMAENVPPGRGITCEIVYSNATQVSWQMSLLRKLVAEGLSMEGLTFRAGLPSHVEIRGCIEDLRLNHICFESTSPDSIRQVVEIAKIHPNFPIGLYWVGEGKAVGLDAFEGFYEPILHTYSEIRSCSNMFLIARRVLGGASGAYACLSGHWSKSYKRPSMPFDGICFGSQIQVTKESHASVEAKDLITDAVGLQDEESSDTFDKLTGDTLTLTSELGQPINVLSTRAALLWQYFDRNIFTIADESRRLQMLSKQKDYIIGRLNKDFHKPWFGVDADKRPCDLKDMTYFATLARMVRLMYVGHQSRWVDSSYLEVVKDFALRSSDRLGMQGLSELSKLLPETPDAFLEAFKRTEPSSDHVLLHPEDVAYFIGLCSRRHQKPVSFIPCLSEDFEIYFKKDSLLQSEYLDAIFDQDVQRSIIIHDPIMAIHSSSLGMTCKQILDETHDCLLHMLQGDPGMMEYEPLPKARKNSLSVLEKYAVESSSTKKSYQLPINEQVPSEHDWLEQILSDVSTTPWTVACISNITVVQNEQRESNPMRASLRPLAGHTLTICYDPDQKVESLTVSRGRLLSDTNINVVHIFALDDDHVIFDLAQEAPSNSRDANITFTFQYLKYRDSVVLTDVTLERNQKIKKFHAQLWLESYDADLFTTPAQATFSVENKTITSDSIETFAKLTGATSLSPTSPSDPREGIPIDMSVALAWEALVQPLLTYAIDGNLFHLSLVSNETSYCRNQKPLSVGDRLSINSRVSSVSITTDGKLVEVWAKLYRDNAIVTDVRSIFIFRGKYSNHQDCFRNTREPIVQFSHISDIDESLLKSRTWLHLDDGNMSLTGQTISFALESRTSFDSRGEIKNILVAGPILAFNRGSNQKIGVVEFISRSTRGNPVMDFLLRNGTTLEPSVPLSNPGWEGNNTVTIKVPKQRMKHIFDSDPKGNSPPLASAGGLPSDVSQKMQLFAAIRNAISQSHLQTGHLRFHKVSAKYLKPVHSGDIISVQFDHVAMKSGRLVLEVVATHKNSGARVLEAEVEAEQERSVYVFTGQGSQEQGMGMSLYEESKAAKEVWTRADRHLYNLYGKWHVYLLLLHC